MSESTKVPTGLRLPFLNCEEAINAAEHLTSEEKTLAIDNLKKMPVNDSWYVLNNDPQLCAVLLVWGSAVFELFGAPPGTPGSIGWLSLFEVGRITGADYLSSLQNTQTANAVRAGLKIPDFDLALLGMLEFPDSELWNDEQRLTLKFTRALLEHTMTDELFAQAKEAWGAQYILRFTTFVGWTFLWAMVQNSTNLLWAHGFEGQGAGNPEMLAAYLEWQKSALSTVMSFWNSTSPFGK